VARWRVAERQPGPQHGERDREAGQRARHAHIQELPPVESSVRSRINAPMVPMNDGNSGTGMKYGGETSSRYRRAREVVPELVAHEDGEQRNREHKARRPRRARGRGQRICSREQIERVAVRDRARQHRACKGRGDQGREEQRGVQKPRSRCRRISGRVRTRWRPPGSSDQ